MQTVGLKISKWLLEKQSLLKSFLFQETELTEALMDIMQQWDVSFPFIDFRHQKRKTVKVNECVTN